MNKAGGERERIKNKKSRPSELMKIKHLKEMTPEEVILCEKEESL